MSQVVVLTGGTGFIGQRLGVALVAAGYHVRVICRSPHIYSQQMSYPCELFAWEKNETQDYLVPEEALEDAYAVIHLAGEPIAAKRWSKKQKQRILSSRTESTKAMAQAIKKMPHPPQVFIQSSAIGFYGDAKNRELSETSPAGKGFLASTCVAWENAAQALQQSPVRSVAIRTGLVLGWEGGLFPLLNDVYTAQLGAVLGDGKQWQSWIHIDDLIALYLFALSNDQVSGPINATAPHPVQFSTLHRQLARKTGGHAHKRIPAAILRLLLGEQSSLVLDSQRVVCEKALQYGFEFRHTTLNNALDALYLPIEQTGSRVFTTHQWVPASSQKVWDFFTNEANLERTTPDLLNFQVTHKSHDVLREGARIAYRLKLHGFPIQWESKMIIWRDGAEFVDLQSKGPFAFWRHSHGFAPLGDGMYISDFIQYRLPMPRWLHGLIGLFVQRDLRRIFSFRRPTIGSHFAQEKQLQTVI